MLDPSVVLRVYENLLSNAVRFATGNVSVSTECRDECLFLTVKDDAHSRHIIFQAHNIPSHRLRGGDDFFLRHLRSVFGQHFAFLFLTVKDDGEGFTQKDLANAVKPFYKAMTDSDEW